MKWLERIFQRLEGEEPEEWPLPHDLLFLWLALGLPLLLSFLLVTAFYAGAKSVPVDVEKHILSVNPDGSYEYYIRLLYTTPEGRFPVSRVSTIFYSDLESSGPFQALYCPLKPNVGFLEGLRGFWLPMGMLSVFVSLIMGGLVWLARELLRKDNN